MHVEIYCIACNTVSQLQPTWLCWPLEEKAVATMSVHCNWRLGRAQQAINIKLGHARNDAASTPQSSQPTNQSPQFPLFVSRQILRDW